MISLNNREGFYLKSVSLSEAIVVARLRRAGCAFAEEEARMLMSAVRTPADLEAMLARRESGVPLEVVLGWAEFCGLRIAVDPDVFVPRRRTALVVQEAVALAAPHDIVVDICCGSGAIGAALLSATAPIELYSVDNHAATVRCARRNIGSDGQVFLGDLYEPLPATLRGRVNVITANAPYVPTESIGTMPPEARLYEPMEALDGGHDGLVVQRRIAGSAPEWLAPGGYLLIETSRQQAPQTAELMVANGMQARVVRSTELDATVVVGAMPTLAR